MDPKGRDQHEAAPPRYEEVVKDLRVPNNQAVTPSAPPRSDGQNEPSILRSSSPPAYWSQMRRGGNNGTPAPSAPAWGAHLPSVQAGQPYPNLESCAQNRRPGLLPRTGHTLCYQLWRGFPVTPQKLTSDLSQAWGHGIQLIRRRLSVSISRKSVYRWLGMQVVLASLALLFSMMPNRFFHFYAIQWLLTTVIVISIVDLAVNIYLNHPNRALQPYSLRFKMYFGLVRSSFYDCFLYPILILSTFRIIRSQSYEIFHGDAGRFDSTDTWGFAMFSTVGTLYIMTVYIMKFSVFTSAVNSLLYGRTNISGSGKFGSWFLKGFVLHVIVQVAVQVMLLILICVRYQAETGAGDYNPMQKDMEDDEDNDDRGDPDGMPNSGGISRFLKLMISGGLLLPLFALPLYFLAAQKLVEEFPISFVLDSPSEQRAISDTSRVDTNKLKMEFHAFHKYNASLSGGFLNLLQPLFSPFQMVACALYAVYLMSFFICFSSAYVVNEETKTLNVVNAFKTGYYSNIESMSLSAIEATFALALIGSIFSNIIPMLYGTIGTVLLPLNMVVGMVWSVLKSIQAQRHLSSHTV